MRIHAKLAARDTLDVPEGWPVETALADERAPLTAGFDVIFTEKELADHRAALQAKYDEIQRDNETERARRAYEMEINAERDRRVGLGFEFNGARFDSRAEDQTRINGAASLAHIALTLWGVQPGDLRWHGGEADFAWIASDNTLVPMDAPTVIEFGAAAARWESLHVFAARALKDQSRIPPDYTDDKYWP